MNRDSEIAAETHEKIADSADTLKDSAIEQTESADRRTVLAADRTMFAAERTYAAWVRTGLAVLASGVGARALMENVLPDWIARGTGTILILLSGFCFVAAVWREMWPGAPPPRPNARRLPAPLLIVASAFLLLVSCAALIGIWAVPK
jgi:putative membrane protein